MRALGRGPVPPERVGQTLHRINEVSDRLTDLTRDLLDVSRLRTGQFAIDARPIDVVPMLRDIVTRYRAQLSETHELRVELTLGSRIISGDRDRLEQVIVNLLENAAKYSPPGGVIHLRAREDAEGVLISVHDDGIGLPPGAAETIFEPFGRAANAVARQVPGMGLGLHICRSIVEGHAGRIWASSDGDGRGTTVWVWLPGLDDTSLADSPPTSTAARA
jgi:signal transduction histidine kinase